jgi:hypothetical protein
MLLPDLKAGLSNIYISLIDDGRLAAAVWASPNKVPFITLTINTVLKETNSPPPPAGQPGPFTLSDENILKDSFINSGFKDVTIEKMNVTFDFDSAEAYTNYVYETASPLQAILAKHTHERSKAILKSVTEAAKKYASNNTGRVRFENEAKLFVGKK